MQTALGQSERFGRDAKADAAIVDASQPITGAVGTEVAVSAVAANARLKTMTTPSKDFGRIPK
jgi:hypothetical protein